MPLWNYMGEFFLFRWLFGKFKKSPTEHNAHIERLWTSIDRDAKSLNDNYNEEATPIDDAIVPISDDLIDDSESSEDLDDLDIFMRNNTDKNFSGQQRDYSHDYHRSSHHSGYHNWSPGSYGQSYDDFHDEQDDYDMMDDDF